MELWVLVLIISGVVIAIGLIVDLIMKLKGKTINMEDISKNKKETRKKYKGMDNQREMDHDDVKRKR